MKHIGGCGEVFPTQPHCPISAQRLGISFDPPLGEVDVSAIPLQLYKRNQIAKRPAQSEVTKPLDVRWGLKVLG